MEPENLTEPTNQGMSMPPEVLEVSDEVAMEEAEELLDENSEGLEDLDAAEEGE